MAPRSLHAIAASAAVCALIWLFEAQPAEACSYAITELNMPPSFTVVVTDQDVPVPGLSVRLTVDNADPDREGLVIFEGMTDSEGSVEIRDLSPDLYDLEVGYNTAFGNFSRVRISALNLYRVSRKLQLKWINQTVLSLKEFSGFLRYENYPDSDEETPTRIIPLRGASLSIKDSHRELVAEVFTQADGYFDLSQLGSGLYVVEIKVPYEFEHKGYKFSTFQEGSFPLEISVDEGVASGPIELSVGFTGCGLTWDVKPLQ